MFTRSEGWIVIAASSGLISHHFKLNQTKSTCGKASTTNGVVDSEPIKSNPYCKQCHNYSKIIKIPKTGRKHRDGKWGGLKY